MKCKNLLKEQRWNYGNGEIVRKRITVEIECNGITRLSNDLESGTVHLLVFGQMNDIPKVY